MSVILGLSVISSSDDYLISLWTVWVLQCRQNFLSSKRAVVLRRFFVVVYRETPGERLLGLVRHSVHSKVTMIRTPLAIVFQVLSGRQN
jgi:hypothetical protein